MIIKRHMFLIKVNAESTKKLFLIIPNATTPKQSSSTYVNIISDILELVCDPLCIFLSHLVNLTIVATLLGLIIIWIFNFKWKCYLRCTSVTMYFFCFICWNSISQLKCKYICHFSWVNCYSNWWWFESCWLCTKTLTKNFQII